MRALRLHRVGGPVTVDELPDSVAALGEVVVRVEVAGICGSDFHIVSGQIPLPSFPRVLGHELAGTVISTGPVSPGERRAEAHDIGTQVVANFLQTCGQCGFCVAGRTSLCIAREGIGLVRDGGLAELIAVPTRNLIAVPSGVELRHAALATDAYATPYHAIFARARVTRGAGCVVIGAGGLGLAAVQLLVVAGATTIVAIDVSRAALDAALACGATHVFLAEAVAGRSDLAGLDHVQLQHAFDFVGSPGTVQLGTDLVDRGGSVTVVGHSDDPWRTSPGSVMVREEKSVVGSYAFDSTEIAAVLALMQSGAVDAAAIIGAELSLQDAATLLSGGHADHGFGRTVVVPR